MSNNESTTYRIRPSGRHLLTIGRELIQDQYAAIVELVKNAFDADSPDVEIQFRGLPSGGFEIVVKDHGHGMSRDTVTDKWLVPSTDDKLKRLYSPGGRRMQGRKGIGRYAAALLGDDLLLDTIDANGSRTTVYIEWKLFEEADFLSDVPILVESTDVDQPSGTTLTISASPDAKSEWTEKQVDKLRFELRKMIPPPFKESGEQREEFDFNIRLTFENFLDGIEPTREYDIEPYGIFDLFDYRICGRLDAQGKGALKFLNQKARNTVTEEIQLDIGETRCGSLVFDIRVFDRDPDAISALIRRGLKNSEGAYLGKNQAKNLLNTLNGISVVRNGFRIRPLGDADFDWLQLNKDRIQNPSMRVSDNQVIGYVQIQPEEDSNLLEKSARDGLKENDAYSQLIRITRDVVLSELESRRYIFRQSEGLGRKAVKLEKEITQLFLFQKLADEIEQILERNHVSTETISRVVGLVEEDSKQKNELADEIRKTVAIYQGQATLGKIVNVILHEGRNPLKFLIDAYPNLEFLVGELESNYSVENSKAVVEIAKGLLLSAKAFEVLFKRLDPLAAAKRGSRADFLVLPVVEHSFQILKRSLIDSGIDYDVDCDENARLFGWEQDLLTILVNLIDNGIYWLANNESTKREIKLIVDCNADLFVEQIDYRDTGKGIDPRYIESGVIFDPEFSTKPKGTGLGLAISGEAASRLGMELKAFNSEKGAYFRIQKRNDNEE